MLCTCVRIYYTRVSIQFKHTRLLYTYSYNNVPSANVHVETEKGHTYYIQISTLRGGDGSNGI